MANLALVFDLIGRDQGASRTFKSVGDAGESAADRTGNAVGRLNGAFEGMTGAAKAFLGAGLVAGFASLYNAADEQAKIGRRTENVIRSTGGAANVTAQQVNDLATAISQKTGADDEMLQSGENLLLTFTNIRNEVGRGNDIFNQATAIANDMSVALGQDMSSSAIQLGKALNDPIKGITALQRVGVSFTQSQKDQIKTLVASGDTLSAQKIILAELTREFGGAAEAASTPLGKLGVQLGNVAEQVGSYLIPVVDKAATFFTNELLPALDGVGGAFGGIVGPAFSAAVDVLGTIVDLVKGAVDVFTSLPGPIQATVGVMAGLAAFKGPIGDLFGTIRGLAETAALKVLYAKDAIAGLGGAGGVAKAGLGGLTSFFGGPWGIALGAATIGLTSLFSWLNKTSSASVDAAGFQRDLARALKESGGVIDENVRALVAQTEADQKVGDSNMLRVAKELGVSLPQMTDALLGSGDAMSSIRDRLNGIIDASLSYKNAGDATWTANAERARLLLSALDQLAPSTQQAADKQALLQEATTGAGGAMGQGSGAAAALTQGLQDAADAADEGRNQIDLLKTSLDVLTGDNVSMIEVQSALNAAIADGTDAIKSEGGAVLDASGALNTHTENGRAAANVLLDIRNRGNDLIATMIQQGATTEDVTAADANLRQSFIDTAKQMGIADDAAYALADQILGIPPSRTTTIIADTGQAQATIDKLVKGINSQGLIGLIGTIGGKADGGLITGPGTGRSDTAGLFALSNGEFVVNAAATAKHRPFLEAINSGIRGMANGGYINYPSSADFLAMVDMTPEAKGKLQGALSGVGAVGSGVQRWSGLVSQVLGILGQPLALVGRVLQLIQHESGGNPNAINLWDSNAKRGTPSIGLMQTIGPTFNAYAGPYRNLGIYNPLANIYAGLNYGVHRYGSVMNIPGIKSLAAGGGYKPYDSGGLLEPGLTLAYNGTGKAETVRTAEQEAALRGGGGAVVLQLDGPATVDLLEGLAVTVVTSTLDRVMQRGDYNG